MRTATWYFAGLRGGSDGYSTGRRRASLAGVVCALAACVAACSGADSESGAQPSLGQQTDLTAPSQAPASGPTAAERGWLGVVEDFQQVTAFALETLGQRSSDEEQWQLLLNGDDEVRVAFAAAFSVLNDCTILLLQAGAPSKRFSLVHRHFEEACVRFEAGARHFVNGIGAPLSDGAEANGALLHAAIDEAVDGWRIFEAANTELRSLRCRHLPGCTAA